MALHQINLIKNHGKLVVTPFLSMLIGSWAVGLTALGQTSSSQQQTSVIETPNILVIVCEDISPYLGCYGDKTAHTPYLDHFSTQSVLHTNMFTCIGVSSPSRYSLITGRYSSADGANYMRSNYFNKKFGVVPPAKVKCFTELLRLQGYYCTNNAKTDYQFPVPLSAWDEQGSQAHWKNAPSDRPFFSIFNLNQTHESQIWENTDLPLLVSPDKIILPPYHPDTEIVRHDYAVMYSNIEKMDIEFNRILKELDQSERAKNTIVLFYSDNGGPLPRCKREILDSGTRVPFMIRFPNHERMATLNHSLNMFVDIPATILSLAGIPTPSYMHGQAMYGHYKSSYNRQYVFGATDRFDEQVEKRASVRSARYLYIRNYMPQQSLYRPVSYRLSMPMMQEMLSLYEKGKLNKTQRRWFEIPTLTEELYDCLADPHQIHNLATDPRYTDCLDKMRRAYQEKWISPFNQEWELYPESYFVRKMWPEGIKPQCERPCLRIKDGIASIENDLDLYTAVYQINGKGLLGRPDHWIIYREPIYLDKEDSLVVRLERIGYTPSVLCWQPILKRLDVQTETALPLHIVDGQWVAVGIDRDYAISRDTTMLSDSAPAYRFELREDDNIIEGLFPGEKVSRAELSYCYATPFDYPKKDKLECARRQRMVHYAGKGCCRQGSKMAYSFKVRIPSSVNPHARFIFAQWHSMPTRMLISDPDGNVFKPGDKGYDQIRRRIIFRKGQGYEKGKPNGWTADHGGQPVMAFGFADGHFYIKANSDRKRVTNVTEYCDAQVNTHSLLQTVSSDFKTSTLISRLSWDEFPKDQWVTFHIEVQWSVFDLERDLIKYPGRINVDMYWQTNDTIKTRNLVSNQEVQVGRNDKDGYYFKCGIYRTKGCTIPVQCHIAGYTEKQL